MPPTEKQVNEFEEKAFIVIKGFFSLDEMMKIFSWEDELRDKQAVWGRGGQIL